jgi:hypothetical protein
MLLSAVVMFGGWGLAYYFIAVQNRREQTYGIPLVNICLNFSWEFLFAWQIIAPLPVLIDYGDKLWFFVDCVLVWQLYRYGRRDQKNPWVAKHFTLITTLTLGACVSGMYLFCLYFNDVLGVAASFMINLLMSVLFINLLFSRPTLRGISLAAAWCKWAGTAAGAVFCTIWWPLQFQDGRLVTPPFTPEPADDYRFMTYLYVTIFIVDLLYIYLIIQRRKELRAAAGPVADHASGRASASQLETGPTKCRSLLGAA